MGKKQTKERIKQYLSQPVTAYIIFALALYVAAAAVLILDIQYQISQTVWIGGR